MAGNVEEWCSDWFDTYSSAIQINPTGPVSGSYRIFRGGGWWGGAWSSRVACRIWYYPDERMLTVGFRVYRWYPVRVPDLAGLSLSQAEVALAAAGLLAGEVTGANGETMTAGYVIRQIPAACESVWPGSVVNLVVLVPNVVWVAISDLGVPGHERFNGQMSQYETTNGQYCQFLNEALASGDITVSGNDVKGAVGSNSGTDFAGQVYYDLAGSGLTGNGAINGAARINWTGSAFTVNIVFENHPVTYVCWYGATAFTNYYEWRLPTKWEWQAVADFDGSYTYGCGTAIDNSKANYLNFHPPARHHVGRRLRYLWLWPGGSGRQCLGMDRQLVSRYKLSRAPRRLLGLCQ